jgi:hypothetical protein
MSEDGSYPNGGIDDVSDGSNASTGSNNEASNVDEWCAFTHEETGRRYFCNDASMPGIHSLSELNDWCRRHRCCE